ncbi:MAG: metallophosphoesterase, partial [Acidobacteria bacterium]|nr:metallophosphoesterase [Acidobacteriota bacterium]
MQTIFSQRRTLAERFSHLRSSETPLRKLAGDLSKVAKYAIDEANSLSLERVTVELDRLPKKLNGFKIIHLSDIHHSPFTSFDHIARTVKIANRLKPDMFVLTGDYVSHELSYIRPVAELMGSLQAEFGTHACLGNHDHWTAPDLVTKAFREAGINMLVNEG